MTDTEREALKAQLVDVLRGARFIATPMMKHGWAKPIPEEAERAAEALLASPLFAALRRDQAEKDAVLVENHWAPDTEEGEEIASGSAELIRAQFTPSPRTGTPND